MIDKDLHAILNKEMDKIIETKWQFINENWPIKSNKYNHRTTIKEVNNIEEVKNELFRKLGYIPIFFFLVVLFGTQEYPGPYLEVEKGLLVLYHIVSGKPIRHMCEFVPYSTFYKIYKEFWVKRCKELDKVITKMLKTMFSNIKIRIINALLKNPDDFKHITLLIDGHDSNITYRNVNISKSKFYSYKLKSSGLRTQIVCDVNEMIVYVSKSKSCKDNNDGTMFLNMNLEKNINTQDCIACDGAYTLFINKFLEKHICTQKNITDDNFCYPIRKDKNIELNENEKKFNDKFGSFRSIIEHQFSELGSLFERFDNNHSKPRISDGNHYNLQFKLACLLKNIKKFVILNNINVEPHHILWKNKGFEFPIKEKEIEYVTSNEQIQNVKINRIKKLQSNYLTDIIINEEENGVENIIEEGINKDNNMDIDDNDNGVYEIDKILNHRRTKRNIQYFVKWKGYPESESTWVSTKDFIEKECIDEYWRSINDEEL